MREDWQDLNIRWPGHPKYSYWDLTPKDLVEVIVQKLEMLLFTLKGEILGQDGFFFGADLEYYLWETKLSNLNLKQKIMEQITIFLPELAQLGFDLSLDIFEGAYQDMLQLNFTIQGFNVAFVFA